MRTGCFRRAAAVLLTVAAGSGLLLGAGRASGTTGDGLAGQAIPGDRTGAWFEGTAHLADALETRAQPGDSAQAAAYLADMAYAQAHGPNENGPGIMAASKDGLTDCEGDSVYASPHTGTTAWYILAARHINPLSTTTPISAQ